MSDLPEGVRSSTLAPGQVERCSTQDDALGRVRVQMQRYEERLIGKQIIPVAVMGLYVVNCDKHEKPSHHVDMIVGDLGSLQPVMLPFAIRAAEIFLESLKKRLI